MNEGGPDINKRSARLFRLLVLISPLFFLAYGVLILQKVMPSTYIVNQTGMFALIFWWTIISLVHFNTAIKSKFDAGLRLATFHLLLGSFLIFVSGIASPAIILWIPVTFASYVIFSKRGFWLSIAGLAIVVVADIGIFDSVGTTIASDFVIFLIILVASVVVICISHLQQSTRKELTASRVQESLQRDRVSTIINNLADAVISTDMDGIVKVYNAASLGLLDTNISLNGHKIDDVLKLIDSDGNSVSIFKEFQNARTVTKRDDLSLKFGTDDNMRLDVTFSPIRSSYSRSKTTNTHDGYVIIMRDITKQKSLEEERDEFISVVSHELRTPIAIAEGTVSNIQLMMSHPDVTNSMIKDSVDTAHDQIMFLAGMVNDLSTLSRAERGVGGDIEAINIKELANNLHDKYKDEAKEKNIHLNLDLSPKLGSVLASRLYLEELIQNLITNAIKYTKKGSVTIAFKQKDDNISFSVKDTGIGISKSDQAKLFKKFFRSEDYRTRETNGTGLGLYIAAKLAHKMNTKIKVVSRLNFGSTFSFSLPASEVSKTQKDDK